MRTFALLTYFLISISSFSQLIIDPSVPANTLVQNYLMGGGVTVSNVVYSGGSESLGYFTNGATTNLGFDKGIILSTGRVIDAANNVSAFTSFYTNSGGDNDIAAIASGIVYDATSLSFDVISYSSQIVIRYIFASEEYPEYVCSNFNDAFAFLLADQVLWAEIIIIRI